MKAQISIDLYPKDFSITNFDSIKHDGILVKNCQSNDRLVELVVDDFYSTKFRAKNIKGQMVEGVVCGAPLKGYTVRF